MPRLRDWLSRPRVVLPALVVLHWTAVAVFALSIEHNGWVWYQGGDQIWYATSGWLLGEGELPPTRVGHAWPYLLAPITLAAGRDFVSAMPWIIALNVLVLAPVAIGCIYWIARHLAGWIMGLWAAALWVVIPYVAIPFFRDDYHDRIVGQILPQALGLSGLADYPSMVCLLAAAALVLRAVSTRAPADAILAGLLAGFAIGLKPANVLFVAGPGLAFLIAWRPRAALMFTAGVAPTLIALAVWKARGLGSVPLFAMEEVRLAGGSQLVALSVDQYLDSVDLDIFKANMAGLREWFWSARLLQWVPFAGTVAIGRRSLPAAGLFAGWFFAIALIKGSGADASVESGSFFRFLMPAFPAFLLMLAFIPTLVPTVLRRLHADPPAGPPVSRRALIAAVVLLAAVPAVWVTFARPIEQDESAVLVNGILTPVDRVLLPTIEPEGDANRLTWDAPDTGRAAVFYRVFRAGSASEALECAEHDGAAECSVTMVEVGTTRETQFQDEAPPEGALYRVGVATNWLDDPTMGDVFVVSPTAQR
jgi:hypothetical protein